MNGTSVMACILQSSCSSSQEALWGFLCHCHQTLPPLLPIVQGKYFFLHSSSVLTLELNEVSFHEYDWQKVEVHLVGVRPSNYHGGTFCAYAKEWLYVLCSAMCVIDFSKLMLDEGEEDHDRGVKAVNSQEHGNGTRELVVNGNGNGNGHKQNGSAVPKKSVGTRFVPFKNPVLFLGHTGFSSVFVVEKPWSEVLQQFPAPVFRHVFGT